ncbi:hypothetical protein J6590_077661 [Homalodisca vitripennis]|nr:hypothetical protein J6590_077661 [Homalodisca vitripennis]
METRRSIAREGGHALRVEKPTSLRRVKLEHKKVEWKNFKDFVKSNKKISEAAEKAIPKMDIGNVMPCIDEEERGRRRDGWSMMDKGSTNYANGIRKKKRDYWREGKENERMARGGMVSNDSSIILSVVGML